MIALLLKVAVVTGLYGLVFVGLEILALKYKPSSEKIRKLAHVLAGIGAVLLPAFLSYPEIALVSVGLIIGMAVSMRRQIFKSVHGVDRTTYGELYFPLGMALCALLFPDVLLYTYAMLVIGISDALASLVGQRYGKREFNLLGSHSKSYAGSGAFFVSAVIIGLLLLAGLTPLPILAAGFISIVAAAVLTMVEAACTKGLDNLAVPLAAGGLLWAAQYIGILG
jgi:phytol kinase